MAFEDTTGINLITDRTYTVTSNVLLGSGVDAPPPFSVIRCITGGILRFGAGCNTVFVRCIVIEEDDALGLGDDNYQGSGARFVGGATCQPVFKGCIFTMENGVTNSDWDIADDGAAPEFRKADDGTPCYIFLPTAGTSNYPHFASENAIIDGLTMHNDRAGSDMELIVPPVISDFTIIDTDVGSGSRHVTVLCREWSTVQTETIAGLSARNIATFQGTATNVLELLNPIGDIQKPASDSDARSIQGVLEVYRTYTVSAEDADTQSALNPDVVITATSDDSVKYDTALTGGTFSDRLYQYGQAFNSTTRVDDNSYRRALGLWGYTSSILTFDLEWNALSPGGRNDGSQRLVPDTSYTAATQTPVDAYTSLEDTEKLLDSIKRFELVRTDRGNFATIEARANGKEVQFTAGRTLTITNATPSGYPLEESSGAYTAYTDSSAFSLTSKFDSFAIDSITFSQASVVPSNMIVTGDMELGEITNLTNVTVTGALTLTQAGTYIFSGCTIGEVINTSGGNITIQADPTTVITTNTGPNITIDSSVIVPVTVTVKDSSGPLEDCRVYLIADSGGPLAQGTVILSGLTNASGVIEDLSFVYTATQPVIGTARKSSVTPFYVPGVLGGSINSGGYNSEITLILDE